MAEQQKAQDPPYPPNVLPYPQPYSPFPPPPPGYPPFFAYPPPADAAHPENGQNPPPPPPPYMMAFAPGVVYPYPPQGTPFPPPPPSVPPALTKPKRKQVKMACTNCAAACKRCDESRPCERCVKYGMTSSCVDGQRKERKKGIKRGPYKRKNKSSENAAYTSESPVGQGPPQVPPPSALSMTHQFAPEGFYQALYYGPPGPFMTHPPDSQQQNPDGSSAQPPPPLPHHPGAPPHVGVNGQPVLPPYFYAYPPFSHYPPMFPPLPGLAPPPPGAQPPVPQPHPPLQPPAPGTEVSQPVSTPPVPETHKKDGSDDSGSSSVEKAASEAVAAINASMRPKKRKRSAAKLINGQPPKAKRTKVMTRSTSSAIKEGVVRPEDLEGDGSGLSSGGEKDAEGEVDVPDNDNNDEDVRTDNGNGSGDESSV